MTIVYCDFINGDDTNGTGTASNPYQTITKASTSRTGGDEVRVAKSPEPTNLTGTLSFTNNSTAVTGVNTLFTTELAIGDFIKGGDGYWWEVVTITSDTSATLYKKYSGTTQSGVSSQKLGVTDTGAAAAWNTVVQEVKSSGTGSANLIISGGWDLATESQTGETYFRQMHTTFANRYGFGLYFSSKHDIELSKLEFLRYRNGIYQMFTYMTTFNSMLLASNGEYGILFDNSGLADLTSVVANANGKSGISYSGSYNYGFKLNSPVCNSNGVDGITAAGSGWTIISPTCKCNTKKGITLYGINTIISPTLNSNGEYGIYINTGLTRVLGTLSTSGNTSGAIGLGNGILQIAKANISESTKVGINYTARNDRVSIGDISGQSQIWTDGGNIVSQAATAGGTGKEWKFSITSVNRGANYPLNQEVARVLVAANKQVTVKLYFKKSHATAIKGALVVRGGQIAGVDSDVKVECPSDTNRNQVTLTFTPTEAGVVAIEVWAWYVSSTTDYVIVDDIDITQAD